jgi:hypothetical protein
MGLIRIRSFAAYRANKLFGYKLDTVDRAILSISKMHTHTEFQFSEWYKGMSFSSTMQDDAKCCRSKDIDYTKHPERWDTVSIMLTGEQERAVFFAAKRIENQPYDLTGLLSFASPLHIVKPAKDGWWCTEAVAHLLKAAGVPLLLNPDQYHPSLLDSELRML